MSENEISKIVVDIIFKIHDNIGPGLFESVYEAILEHELVHTHKLQVEKQVPIPVYWDSVKLNIGFRADLIIEEKVLVEIKSIESLAPVHFKQVITYLRLTNIKLGILVNFQEELIKNGIKRIVNNL